MSETVEERLKREDEADELRGQAVLELVDEGVLAPTSEQLMAKIREIKVRS